MPQSQGNIRGFYNARVVGLVAQHGLCFYNLMFVPHTHTRLTALFPRPPGWASRRKVKPIWILLKQETVSGSGISWAICKSAPHSRQITMPAPHHSVFYRPDALPAAQPTASKHWRQNVCTTIGECSLFSESPFWQIFCCQIMQHLLFSAELATSAICLNWNCHFLPKHWV